MCRLLRYSIQFLRFQTRRPIFQADFINIHVTNAWTLVKRVNFKSNSFVNHTMPLCLQNMHMLYLRIIYLFWCTVTCSIVAFEAHVDVKTMEKFLQDFYDKFMMCADAKIVAAELRRRRVIPQPVEIKIKRALDTKTANGHLYDHLFSQGTDNTLRIVCDVFIQEEGYPRMNELGKKLKEKLAHMHTASSGELLYDL